MPLESDAQAREYLVRARDAEAGAKKAAGTVKDIWLALARGYREKVAESSRPDNGDRRSDAPTRYTRRGCTSQ